MNTRHDTLICMTFFVCIGIAQNRIRIVQKFPGVNSVIQKTKNSFYTVKISCELLMILA